MRSYSYMCSLRNAPFFRDSNQEYCCLIVTYRRYYMDLLPFVTAARQGGGHFGTEGYPWLSRAEVMIVKM